MVSVESCVTCTLVPDKEHPPNAGGSRKRCVEEVRLCCLGQHTKRPLRSIVCLPSVSGVESWSDAVCIGRSDVLAWLDHSESS